MRMSRRGLGLTTLFALLATVAVWELAMPQSPAKAGEAEAQSAEPQPVDDDMHHFMEYIFEPAYSRLKTNVAQEPKDKAVWSAVKGDSLTLAECANLLLLRAPAENAEAWKKLSLEVRQHGGELYQAARKSDYATARKAYATMIKSCNACHHQFADGEHQLMP